MMKSALPYLRKQRGGHFVNVTGLTGHMGTPALSARCASDHALEGFCDVGSSFSPQNLSTLLRIPVTGAGIRDRSFQHKSDNSATTYRSQVSHPSFPPRITALANV